MKKNYLTLLFASTLFSVSCENDDIAKPNFNLSGAKAILSGGSGSSGGRVSSTGSDVFKLDESGNLTPIAEDIRIAFVKTLSDGLFLVTSDQRKFYVRLDNTYDEITGGAGNYKGVNLNGDIIFDNAKIFRKSTLKLEDIQSNLNTPMIQSVSGNYAIITNQSVFQILNTVNSVRYNVNGCNGPRMMYLNESTALINDCQNKILINMANGERTEAEITGWNHEAVTTPEGVVLLSQGLSESHFFQLGRISPSGDLTLLSEYEFEPGSFSCMNCGFENETLYSYGDFFIIKELSNITIVKKGNTEAKHILAGYNVISLDVNENLVYYLAENSLGTPIVGIYNLITESNQIVNETFQFEIIQTFN